VAQIAQTVKAFVVASLLVTVALQLVGESGKLAWTVLLNELASTPPPSTCCPCGPMQGTLPVTVADGATRKSALCCRVTFASPVEPVSPFAPVSPFRPCEPVSPLGP
jgi:hypothetical protein